MSADRASAYDAWYATPLGAAAHARERAIVERLAGPHAGERALDAGCGTGIYTVWLAERGLEVTGVDRDPAMLAAARRKVPNAVFLEADVTALPFPDGEFDLALAVTLFCFLDERERQAAAAELVRLTKPGGRVVIGELARYSLWAAQRRLKGWRGSSTWRNAHFTTAGELRELLERAGAANVETRHGLYLPPWSNRALVTRAPKIEQLARRLGPLGAAFVAARGERMPAPLSTRPDLGGAARSVPSTREEHHN